MLSPVNGSRVPTRIWTQSFRIRTRELPWRSRVTRGSLILCLLSSLLPAIANADSNVTAAISSINVYQGTMAQVANITFSTPLGHPEGCMNYAPDNVIRLDFSSPTEPSGKTLYATVLAAFLAGRSVQFGVRGCDPTGSLAIVYSVEILSP